MLQRFVFLYSEHCNEAFLVSACFGPQHCGVFHQIAAVEAVLNLRKVKPDTYKGANGMVSKRSGVGEFMPNIEKGSETQGNRRCG